MVFSNAITDAHGKAPSSADTTLLADASGTLRLNGYKFYSTGTLFADVIAVSAIDAEGRDLQALVPTDRAGVEPFDDWDGFGQRLTASGGTRFTDVAVHPVEVTRPMPRELRGQRDVAARERVFLSEPNRLLGRVHDTSSTKEDT